MKIESIRREGESWFAMIDGSEYRVWIDRKADGSGEFEVALSLPMHAASWRLSYREAADLLGQAVTEGILSEYDTGQALYAIEVLEKWDRERGGKA